MILTPAQKQIASDTHRFRVLNCGRRFGKTSLAVVEMIGKAVAKKDRRVAYIAPTYQQARDIAWAELKKIAQTVATSINESRLEITLKTQDEGTSVIVLRGWESVETLRGQKFDFLVLDEVREMKHFFVYWHDTLEPTLLDTIGEAMFISTPNGFDHFYNLYNKQDTDDEYKSFHFTTYDNPHLPLEYLEKQRGKLPEDSFAQEYLADFRKMQGLVYKEFDRDRHLIDSLPEGNYVETIAGVDFGYNHPCAVTHIKKNSDGVYFVYDEWYKTQQTEAQIAEYVAGHMFTAVYPDPESPSAIAELEKRHVNIREVIKGKDSVKSGIDKVRELFKSNRLFVLKGCKNLVTELESYQYDEKQVEKPVKDKDDAVDSLRYALMMNYSEVVFDDEEELSLYV